MVVSEELERSYRLAFDDRKAKVNSLQHSNSQEALKEALRKPPVGSENENLKTDSLELLTGVLFAVKEADVDAHVNNLSDEHLDVLVKYLYRGLQNHHNANLYLRWHASCIRRSGYGSIVRVISENNTLF